MAKVKKNKKEFKKGTEKELKKEKKEKTVEVPSDKVGMYLVDGRLVQITWDKETPKKVIANSTVHKDSPLLKAKIHKFDKKVMEKYNKLRDEIHELEQKGIELLKKVGLHFEE